MRRGLSFLVLLLLSLSFLVPVTSVKAAKKTPIKIDPEAPALMSVADNKLRISKWAGFSSVDVSMPTIKNFSDYRYETIQLSDGYEINLILNKQPPTNVFEYPLVIQNAEFFYQPPLTSEETAQGCIRPDNVVGSYAVYGTKSNNEYGTGKLAHIYRPKVHDAKGNWIWGVLDYKDGVLSVTVDAKWLAGAVYPVTIDPIFGYNSVGGSTTGLVQGWAYGDLYTTAAAPATSSGISVYAYIASTTGTTNFKVCAWAGTDGGALITNSPLVVSTASASYAWKTANYVSAPTFSASTTYNIGFLVNTNNGQIAYDDIGTEKEDSTNSYASPGNFDWINSGVARFSVYIVIGSAPTITSSTITDMDDSDNCYAMKKYYTFQTEITDTDGATDIKAISVRGMQGANVRWLVNATSLDGVPAYAIITGASTIDLDAGSCTFGEAGNVGTLTLKIGFEWDYTQEEDCELAVWARDVGGATVGWTTVQTDYFDVINRLVTRDFAASVSSIAINTNFTISGKVRYSMTATGYNASTSYPPDAQFTAVKIYTDDGDFVGQNTTITNGAFSVNATSISVIGTTAYVAWLDLVPDYTDGYAVDGDVVYVTTGATFPFVDFLGNAFAFFGLVGAVTGTIYTMLFAFAAWFTNAALMMVDLITSIITFIFFVGWTIIAWFTRIITTIVSLLTIIGSLFDGTYTSGIPNIWVLFNVSAWIDVVPIIMIILWLDSIVKRRHQTGRSELEILVGDIQIASYIVGEVWTWSYTIFNFVLSTIGQIASRF